VDAAGNSAQAESITITVGPSAGGSGPDDEPEPQPEDDDGEPGGGDTDGPTAVSGGALPAAYGDTDPATGCGCRHGGSGPADVVWVLLGLFGMNLGRRKNPAFSSV
jgi:MYXO-CTERM domain-containing protein